jgi:hypothetical protein
LRAHILIAADVVMAAKGGDEWMTDVASYDKVHRHILHMSDVLSDGIVKQVPSRFRQPSAPCSFIRAPLGTLGAGRHEMRRRPHLHDGPLPGVFIQR